MMPFLIASAVSLTLVVVCVLIFYEILAHLWVNLPRIDHRPKLQIVVTILAMFACHTIAIWIFGITYYLLVNHAGFGSLAGEDPQSILSYIYFSGVTYSSLGLGDMYPKGDLRMLIAVEAILGLTLIGWTIAYSYVFTEKYLLHRSKTHKTRKK